TYPTTPGAYSGPGTVDPEIFVSKFSNNGTTLIYSTYISGSSDEMGLGIAVDALGQAYIAGHAMANWTGGNTYPTTTSAYQPAMYSYGGYDAILSVLNATGTGLVYSTYLGGSGDDDAYSVALGTAGIVYITGSTSSSGNTFPTKGTSVAAQQSAQGYNDAFVAKFNITLNGNNSLIYSIHLGGGGDDYGRSIAVNSAGNAFVTGRFQAISSPAFPITGGAYNTAYSGGSDNMMVFVTKLSATTPVTYSYSTYIAPGSGNGITVNQTTGEAYIVGSTSTFSFPTTAGVLQSVHGQDISGNTNSDAFVTKLNAAGSALIYSTFLGGPSGDAGTGIVVNSVGQVYVAGMASVGFPTSAGALQPNHATGGFDLDFFAVQLNSIATGYGSGGSSFVGGNDNDYSSYMHSYPSPKISLRDYGGINDTVAVSGTSHSTNFPTTAGSYSPNKLNANSDQPVFFKLTCSVVNPLPVELISFTGSNQGNRNVLEWATASEINNHYFAIERSHEGSQFAEIGIVKGNGNSTQIISYSFSDDQPVNGINYYRLKQVDYDGDYKYSQIIAVTNIKVGNRCFVYANETAGGFILSCSQLENSQAQIINIDGRILKEIKITGNVENKIDLHDLTNGFYILRINDGEQIQNLKLVKN
ncbi:MAG: T9SS type A sorting domain-containing protein, partial [Bacteroidia bacterium]|nr:T9SS type A sorting domain-containing protein [Bacteroidia bacterium]